MTIHTADTAARSKGWTLLEAGFASAGPGSVTLSATGRDYVTHFFSEADGGFYWGHYFRDLAEAAVDFSDRLRRGY